MILKSCAAALAAACLAGCSGIKFSNRDDGHSHPYRVASPALKVVTDPDCKMTAEVVSIPGKLNYLSFQTGLGKVDATVEFEPGGTIKKIMAKQEGVTDDLVKLLNAGRSFTGASLTESAGGCKPSVAIYPIHFDASSDRATVDMANPLLKVDATLAE